MAARARRSRTRAGGAGAPANASSSRSPSAIVGSTESTCATSRQKPGLGQRVRSTAPARPTVRPSGLRASMFSITRQEPSSRYPRAPPSRPGARRSRPRAARAAPAAARARPPASAGASPARGRSGSRTAARARRPGRPRAPAARPPTAPPARPRTATSSSASATIAGQSPAGGHVARRRAQRMVRGDDAGLGEQRGDHEPPRLRRGSDRIAGCPRTMGERQLRLGRGGGGSLFASGR